MCKISNEQVILRQNWSVLKICIICMDTFIVNKIVFIMMHDVNQSNVSVEKFKMKYFNV